MSNLTLAPAAVNLTPSAAQWPAWTDADRWTISEDAPADLDLPVGPDDADAAWWALETRQDGPTDAEWDRLAAESEAMRLIEAGCY